MHKETRYEKLLHDARSVLEGETDPIACDERSNSEMVVPVFDGQGRLRAVLDIDSEQYNAFDQVDQKYLEELLGQTKGLEWNGVS